MKNSNGIKEYQENKYLTCDKNQRFGTLHLTSITFLYVSKVTNTEVIALMMSLYN